MRSADPIDKITLTPGSTTVQPSKTFTRNCTDTPTCYQNGHYIYNFCKTPFSHSYIARKEAIHVQGTFQTFFIISEKK